MIELLLVTFLTLVSGFEDEFDAAANLGQEDFETYTNEDYGFSTEYPSDWTLREYDLIPNQVVVFEGPDTQKIHIVIRSLAGFERFEGMNIHEIHTATDYKANPDNDRRIIESGNTTMGGFPAHYSIYYISGLFKQVKIMEVLAVIDNPAINATDMYSINYLADPGYFNATQINKILESFKVGVN